jgi:hypothetical protein
VSLVDAALSGPPASPGAAARRSAFIVGNVGKLGDELLNAVLESQRYSRVAVSVRAPMRVEVPKLETVVAPAAPGWVPDDAFICIEPEESFWKSKTPYVAVASESAAAIAAAIRARGTRRLAVVTPLEALQQLGATSAIRNADELAIVNAGYERLLILRPVAAAEASGSGGFFQAVGGGVVQILASYMTPRSLQPIRRRQAAQATVELLATLPDGVHVVGAPQLREMVGDPLGGKRLY